MAKIYVFLADGCEEIEALTPVDILRRAGEDVVTVSVMGRKEVTGSHGITVQADLRMEGTFGTVTCCFFRRNARHPKSWGERTAERADSFLQQRRKTSGGNLRCSQCSRITGCAGRKEGCLLPRIRGQLKGAEVLQVSAVTSGNVTTAGEWALQSISRWRC